MGFRWCQNSKGIFFAVVGVKKRCQIENHEIEHSFTPTRSTLQESNSVSSNNQLSHTIFKHSPYPTPLSRWTVSVFYYSTRTVSDIEIFSLSITLFSRQWNSYNSSNKWESMHLVSIPVMHHIYLVRVGFSKGQFVLIELNSLELLRNIFSIVVKS